MHAGMHRQPSGPSPVQQCTSPAPPRRTVLAGTAGGRAGPGPLMRPWSHVAYLSPADLRADLRHHRIGHAGRRRQGQGAQSGGPAGHRRSARASPTSRPRTTSSRPPSEACAQVRDSTSTPPRPGCPNCARRSRRRPRATPATRSPASQVLITNGGKQAVYEAFATLLDPGDEVLLPTPYWTTYPEAIKLAGGVRGAGADRRAHRLPGQRGQPGGGAHRADQGAAVRVAVQPDRRGLPARAGGRDRPLGGGARHLGGHRRDLRAPGLRGRQVHARCRWRRRRSPTAAWSSTGWPRPTR